MGNVSLPQEAVAQFLDTDQPPPITVEVLDQFLADTAHLPESKSERLRHFGIALGGAWHVDRFDLQKIFERSIAEDPDNEKAYCSALICIHSFLMGLGSDSFSEQLKVAAYLEDLADAGLKRFPRSSQMHFLMGSIFYDYPTAEPSVSLYNMEAAAEFLIALDIEPGYQMARLYLSHCFQDAGQWRDAFSSYSSVDKKQLAAEFPEQRWRIFKLSEQICLCCAMMGEKEQAEMLLAEFFTELEALSPEILTMDIVNLNESVQILREVIHNPALNERLCKLITKCDLEYLYK